MKMAPLGGSRWAGSQREDRIEVRPICESLITKVSMAGDQGNWADFVTLTGGPSVSRRDCPLQLFKVWDDRLGQYGEPLGNRVVGVQCGNVFHVTRLHSWKFSREVRTPLPPWSTVNNCTGICSL